MAEQPTDGQTEESTPAWHALPPEDVLEQLDADSEGLSDEAAEARLEEYGENRQRPPERRSGWMRFLSQFRNLLIYLLIAAAVVTAILGQWIDTVVIVAVVLINALIGYIQEGKAESAMEAIREMLSPEAVVRRNGTVAPLMPPAWCPAMSWCSNRGTRLPPMCGCSPVGICQWTSPP